MQRCDFIGLIGAAVAWPLGARGQQTASRIIGVLGFGSVEGARTGFVPTQRRLAEMGYVEGRNLISNIAGPTAVRTGWPNWQENSLSAAWMLLSLLQANPSLPPRPPPHPFQSYSLPGLIPS
jgi:hypothetical protein